MAARCRTFTVHARSLSYIHCTRPLAVVHSLYTPARCRTFTAHGRSLLYIHCSRPLAVAHSLHMAARYRTFTVHARSLLYIHCTRPFAVVHALHTPARSFACSLSYTSPPRCRLLVVTAPLAGPPCLPPASFDIREYHFRRQCYGWRSLPRAAGFDLCILFVFTCDDRRRTSNHD